MVEVVGWMEEQGEICRAPMDFSTNRTFTWPHYLDYRQSIDENIGTGRKKKTIVDQF